MKVLFAVSNENISNSIMKKYQEQHKEIISGKNVYYFNAIIKELQKDKSYDRIVISEDLEPFANNNYDTIDKFLFDKLDSISDEAANFVGGDIPIILISSDRRTKGEPILVKLFGIGIYSALLGNDRSIDMVCDLLNKPRTKKEAKSYYKIDSDDVEYKAESENEVSEAEIQNILTHYKRLGKNEEKYVESFASIASQYTDEQLKIIIRVLPLNVRAVLEEKSAQYQKLMTFADIQASGGSKKKSGYVSSYEKEKQRKKKEVGGVELIEKQLKAQKLSKPVIIPSTVNTSKVKRVEPKTTTQSLGKSLKEARMGQEQGYVPAKERMKKETTSQSLGRIHAEEKAGRKTTSTTTSSSTTAPKRMHQAVPSTTVKPVQPKQTLAETIVAEPAPKKRGRPKKQIEEPVVEQVPEVKEEVIVEAPKRRGRPKKQVEHVEEKVTQAPVVEEIEKVEEQPEVQKRRGRPKKNVEHEPIAEEPVKAPQENLGVNLFDLDEEEEEFDIPDSYKKQYHKEEAYNEAPERETAILPGFDEEEYDDDDNEYFDEIDNTQEPIQTKRSEQYYEPVAPVTLPGVDTYDDDEEEDFFAEPVGTQEVEPTQSYQNSSASANLDYLLAGDKKIVSFVGTSKNGTSFLVNNVAELLSEKGIKTAILDTTKNKNAYYIYTENEESLRKTAFNSIKELTRGNAQGIPVNKNLDVYTTIPENDGDLAQYGRILETLAQNYTVVLIDCDFETNYGYFSAAQEIYLVQSMDILTIQPLTAFLTDLKAKGILQPEKLRVIINKYLRVRGVTEKIIIGGMAFYNDPTMSVMTELFDKDNVKYCVIGFDEQVYSKYLEGLVECKISTRNYTKKFLTEMVKLREMVYPLMEKNTPKYGNYKESGFSNNMNNTLAKMKKSRF